MTLIKGLTKEEVDTHVAVYRDTLRAGWEKILIKSRRGVRLDNRQASLNISEEEVEAFRVGMVGSLRTRIEAFNRACKIESELGIPLEVSEIDTGASPSGVSLNTGVSPNIEVLDFPHDEESYGVGPL